MSSDQRWIVGEDADQDRQDESEVGVSTPLLPANIPTKTPFSRMVSQQKHYFFL